ncbi:MAG: PHP domain-containing protein [Bifidobacteriaceae bacterium]|jgi:predicted metal-dependent phosphoesterase TrpH|nr:PHP domain-containing protein [Bifidobacteriaceae bacterium]
MLIDLHTHSSVSDGTEPPAQVMAQAKAAGLDVVALTDHDTTDGWAEASTAASQLGLTLVRGMELSTRMNGITVHLLSYSHDPSYQPLLDMLGRIHAARYERVRAMTERLAKDYPITLEQVVARVPSGKAIGRPHIADQLVALGVVEDRAAAFAGPLHPRGQYYVRYWSVETPDAVQLVRRAGGVPVFAHPGATGRQRVVDDSAIVRMCQAGLAGLEVYHRDNPPDQRARLMELAGRLNLFVTGSSDYHGAGKPNRLGENLTSETALRQIVEQGQLPLVGGLD